MDENRVPKIDEIVTVYKKKRKLMFKVNQRRTLLRRKLGPEEGLIV